MLLQGAIGGGYAAAVATLGARRSGRSPSHDWMTVGSVLLRDAGIVARPGAREVAAGVAVRQGAELAWSALWWGGVLRGLDRPQRRKALLAAGIPWTLGTVAVERWGILPWLRPMVKDEIPLSGHLSVHLLSRLTYPLLFLIDPAEDPADQAQDRRIALGAMAVMGGVLAGVAGLEAARRRGGHRRRGTAGEQEADERFVRAMVVHLESSLTLARMAAERGEQVGLRTMGRQLEGEQRDECARLRAWWQARFDRPVPPVPPHERLATAGVLPDEEVERLAGLSGRGFELAFLPTLIRHHRGAVRLSERVRREGKDPDLHAVAGAIAYTRTNQVRVLERLLATARPVEEEATHVHVTERLRPARGRTPHPTLTGRLLDASRKIPLLSGVRRAKDRPRGGAAAPTAVEDDTRTPPPADPARVATALNETARTFLLLRRLRPNAKGQGGTTAEKDDPPPTKPKYGRSG